MLILLFAIIALTRFAAASRSWWDWDEMLFQGAVREYDVVSHQPHPPGFPLYIAAAKVIRPFASNDFTALRALSLIAGVFAAPALFWLAIEIGFSVATSVGAGVLFAFFPTVWIYGGTALSDVPSIVLALVAAALLLRARRMSSTSSYLTGAVVLGIAAGFRPQNLLVGLAPGLLASWSRFRTKPFQVVAVIALGATIVAGSFVGAALASRGWESYRRSAAEHQEYIASHDAVGSPDRPPLVDLIDDFFVLPYGKGALALVLSGLVLLSILSAIWERRSPVLLAIATLGPFALFAWLMLDWMSARRFAIGYLPLLAILAADGIAVMARRSSRDHAVPLELAGIAVVAVGLALWALPAIREVRSTLSPPASAIAWIQTHVDRNTARIFVARGMLPFAEYALEGWHIIPIPDERGVPMIGPHEPPAFLLTEGAMPAPAENFARPRNHRLWRFVRHRYFEVAIVPLKEAARYGDGWYEAENDALETWRWMAGRSQTELPAIRGRAKLILIFQAPLDVLPKPPMITVRINGQVLGQFRAEEGRMVHQWEVDGRGEGFDLLEIETDGVVNPLQQGVGGDGRDLGLLVNSLSWGPVQERR